MKLKKLRKFKSRPLIVSNNLNIKYFFKITSISIFSLLIVLFVIFSLHLSSLNSRFDFIHEKSKLDEIEKELNRDNFKFECVSLYKKILSNTNIHDPPLKELPVNLKGLFEQNVEMPIKYYEYKNSLAKKSNENIVDVITNDELNEYRLSNVDNLNSNINHDFNVVKEQMTLYKEKIKNSNIMVLGSDTPWIEIIAKDLGAKKVVTLDYSRKSYEDKSMEWWHIFDYLDNSINKSLSSLFDFIVSFSTIEHAGLGQYGDALSANGDIEMMKFLNCMLKPDGILMMGLPTVNTKYGYIVFNKERVYGSLRLKLLFEGWKILGGKRSSDQKHTLYIIQKTN